MSLYLRSLLWTIICPGTVTLVLPWFILPGLNTNTVDWGWRQWTSLALMAAGAGILLWCIYAFASKGKGTLSPADPAKKLVIDGLYRYMRNPMYTGVTGILLGESLFSGSLHLLGYTALVFLIFNLFVRLYEEPYLRKQFGVEYDLYCKKVGRWLPNL